MLGQAADIVVALDDLAGDVPAFDTVRINGSLGQESGAGDLCGLGIEHLYEEAAYYLALAFGFVHTFQRGQKLFRSIHAYDIQPQLTVICEHVGEFVLTQQSVVHEYAGKAVAYGLVKQDGRDG